MVAGTAERKTRTKKAPAGGKAPAGTEPKAKRTMDDEHKKALAEGREDSRAVRRYLEAIYAHRPKRGRKVTPDSLRARLAKLQEEQKGEASPFQRLLLNQEQKDIEIQIATLESSGTVDLTDLEAAFVKVGKRFADRRGIDRSTFKDMGVKVEVLKKAGI